MYGNDMNMGFVQPQERPKPRIGIVIFAIIISLAIGAGAMYAYFKLVEPQNKCEDTPAVKEDNKEETPVEEQKQEEPKKEQQEEAVSYEQIELTAENMCNGNTTCSKTVTYGGKTYNINLVLGEDGAVAPGDMFSINNTKVFEGGDCNYFNKVAFLKTGYIAVHYSFEYDYSHVIYYDKDLKKSCAVASDTAEIDYDYTPSNKYKCS